MFNSITDPAELHLFNPKNKDVCLKRILLVAVVSFSIDPMNLVKHLLERIQTNHVRRSLVMMQMLFIFGLLDKIFLLVIL